MTGSMAEDLVYQRKIGGVSLEISREEGGDMFASITYPYPDERFDKGGFSVAFAVLRQLLALLSERDGLRSLFLAELAPMLSEEAGDEATLPLDDIEQWLLAQKTGFVGAIDPVQGCWLAPREGLATIERLLEPLSGASAEASRARLLLLESEQQGARGWDVCHEDGITWLGRFRVEIEAQPAPLDPEDLGPTRDLLDALCSAVASKLVDKRLN